jgi:hypothetical protein
MQKNLRELRIDYEAFISNVPSHLAKLKVLLERTELNFSLEEIDQVQVFYTANFKSSEKIGITYEELGQIFFAYAGQAFIHHHGGNWELSTLKNDDAYGTPIIINWGPKGYPWVSISPYVWKVRMERETFRGKLSEAIK